MYGWVFAAHMVGAAIAAWVAGIVRENVGDYAAAFVAAGWIAIIAGFAALAIRRKGPDAEAAGPGVGGAHEQEAQRRPTGETIGGILVGFDQQVFRTLPPAHELVAEVEAGPRALRSGRVWSSCSRTTKPTGGHRTNRTDAPRRPARA